MGWSCTPMIRLLREGDADAYVRLRREALVDAPLAFASSLEPWGSEPDALRYRGTTVSELHMALRLEDHP